MVGRDREENSGAYPVYVERRLVRRVSMLEQMMMFHDLELPSDSLITIKKNKTDLQQETWRFGIEFH